MTEKYYKETAEYGEWVPYPSIPTDIFRCTKCGVYIKLPEKIDRMYYNFCPNCGKKNVNTRGSETCQHI